MEKINKAIRYYRKLNMDFEEMKKFKIVVDYDTKWGCPDSVTELKIEIMGKKK